MAPNKYTADDDSENSKIVRRLNQLILSDAVEKGISLGTSVRLVLEELEKPLSKDSLLTHVQRKQALMRKAAESSNSDVPEGQEAHFPNLVFHEQMLSAVANSVGIDVSEARVLNGHHQEEESSAIG